MKASHILFNYFRSLVELFAESPEILWKQNSFRSMTFIQSLIDQREFFLCEKYLNTKLKGDYENYGVLRQWRLSVMTVIIFTKNHDGVSEFCLWLLK